jgi:hypothetical protein
MDRYFVPSADEGPNAGLQSAPVSLQFSVPVGVSQLDLLSVSMGLNNYGAHMEENQVGIVSPLRFNGEPLTDITHSVGLAGERSPSSLSRGVVEECQELCWYQLKFDTPASYQPSPDGLSTIALDLGNSALSKGILYVNGHMLGRSALTLPSFS